MKNSKWKQIPIRVLLTLALCMAVPALMTLAAGAAEGSDTAVNTDTSVAVGHFHCECGETAVCSDTGHSAKQFTDLSAENATAMPTEGGWYCLTEDVALTRSWGISKDTVLCLNGHTLSMNIVAYVNDYALINIMAGATFTLCDCSSGAPGSVTGAGSQYSSVHVSAEGTFNLYGGSITGNQSQGMPRNVSFGAIESKMGKITVMPGYTGTVGITPAIYPSVGRPVELEFSIGGAAAAACFQSDLPHYKVEVSGENLALVPKLDANNFPDANFLAYLASNVVNTNGDEWLSLEEMAAVKTISVTNMQISDLTGIGYFTNLETLYAGINSIQSLDLSACTKLKTLDLNTNRQLASLNIQACTALQTLNLEDCTGLTSMVSLHLSAFTELTHLNLNYIPNLSLLTLPTNPKLETLMLIQNAFTSLDFSGMTSLKDLGVSGNTALTSLKLTGCTTLETLFAESTALTELDVSTNTKLTKLNIEKTRITAIDLSKNQELTSFQSDIEIYLPHCGEGSVNMNPFGDVTKMTVTSGGTLGTDGWLKLKLDGAGFVEYTYDTGNSNAVLTVHFGFANLDSTHPDTDSNAICDVCNTFLFPGEGTSTSPYLVSSEAQFLAALGSTANETNYIQVQKEINFNTTNSNINHEGKPFVLDLNNYVVDTRYHLNPWVDATIKNGTLRRAMSVYGGHTTMQNVSFPSLQAKQNSKVTLTNCVITDTNGSAMSTDSSAQIIATGLTINKTNHVYSWQKGGSLLLDGVTYTENLNDTHYPHPGTTDRPVSNSNGTHNVLYTCCDKLVSADVPCTPATPDTDCTTSDACACGYALPPAETSHALQIVVNSGNETQHQNECTNDDCTYTVMTEHVYDVKTDYVTLPTCIAVGVYNKLCACGSRGVGTFQGDTLDPSLHPENYIEEYVSNNNGTHKKVYSCCEEVIAENLTCYDFTSNYDCTIATTCVDCSYVLKPAQAAHSFSETYEFNDTEHFRRCQNGCFVTTDNAPHTKPDSNNECATCHRWNPTIENISIAVAKDLTVKYYVRDINYFIGKTIEMRFTVNSHTKTVSGTLNGDQRAFAFDGIAPHWMGDTIIAELLVDGTVKETKYYSVLNYLKSLKSKTMGELNMNADQYGKLQTLINDLLVYGGAAQVFKGYKTDSLVSANVTGSPFTDIQDSDVQRTTETGEGGITFTAATVFFDNVNALKVKLTAADLSNVRFTVKIGEGTESELPSADHLEDLGNGTWTITTDGIEAYRFDDVYTITAYRNGVAVATLRYSVKSYVYAKQSGSDSMAALARATYNYGIAAKAYRDAQPSQAS